jgi:hypothetical protein
VQPMAVGFTAGSVFYGATVLGLGVGAARGRRFWRRRRGRCQRCGYDLRGLSGGACPECGTATTTEAPA